MVYCLTHRGAALGAAQLGAARHAGRREIAGGLLAVHLDLRVERDQPVGDRHLLDDLDALRAQRVVLHVRHRHPAVDAADAEPVEDVRHQLLEAHVLHAGDAFGAVEIGLGAVAAGLALARVVDQELGHLAERAAFLAVVDDDARPRPPAPSRCRPRRRARDRAGRCRCRSRTRPSRCTRRGRGRRSRSRACRSGRHRRTGRPSCRRSAAGTPRGRAGSPARGTCRRFPRTACGAGRARRRRTARRCRAGATPARSPPW